MLGPATDRAEHGGGPPLSMLPGNLPCKATKLRRAQPSSVVKQGVLGAMGELQMVRIFQELAKRMGTRPPESKCPIWNGGHLSKHHSATEGDRPRARREKPTAPRPSPAQRCEIGKVVKPVSSRPRCWNHVPGKASFHRSVIRGVL